MPSPRDGRPEIGGPVELGKSPCAADRDLDTSVGRIEDFRPEPPTSTASRLRSWSTADDCAEPLFRYVAGHRQHRGALDAPLGAELVAFAPPAGAEQLVVDAVRDLDHRYRGDQGLDLGRDAIVEHHHGPADRRMMFPPIRSVTFCTSRRAGAEIGIEPTCSVTTTGNPGRAPSIAITLANCVMPWTCTASVSRSTAMRRHDDTGSRSGTGIPNRSIALVPASATLRYGGGRTVGREDGSPRRSRRNPLCSIRGPGGRRRVRYRRRAAAGSGRRR